MEINRNAPAVAASEIEIAAAPEMVWEVLTEIESWPSWNPDVKSASLEGDLREGTVFRWKAGPGTITSTIRQVERPRLIGWTGKTLGIGAIHVWRFEPRDSGTFVRMEESWDGLVVRILPGPMRKSLQKAVDGGLVHLKDEAERRAQESLG